ncbi:undecaprenyl-diphosphatase [Actinacidiphila yanglinensis]|uniref:Undecaprenyl-diphosphatase n=1 Tax=Actinacidiphila yanglinensis TaxID=310779 RepID=A0A1H6CN99_9ACTN|nr:phosphatase PAP2 family protein [Actinacidiphila yanglinensis]SEG74420.1 undecaprenyl-diphosphatase [Actinacidiphila yanglinensis]
MPRSPLGPHHPLPYTRRTLGWAAGLALAFAVLAAVVLTRHGTPYPVDTGPHRWSVRHRPHGWATAARGVTHAGTGPYPYLAAALGGWLAGSRGRWTAARAGVPLALLAVVGLLAEQLVRLALSTALHRARPPAADWAVSVSGYSFPSGHTSSSAMAAGLLAWGVLRAWPGAVGRTLAVLCAVAAVAVGCSRVYLGVHWPTDVLGGWLYAGCCLLLLLPPLDGYARRLDGSAPDRGSGVRP